MTHSPKKHTPMVIFQSLNKQETCNFTQTRFGLACGFWFTHAALQQSNTFCLTEKKVFPPGRRPIIITYNIKSCSHAGSLPFRQTVVLFTFFAIMHT